MGPGGYLKKKAEQDIKTESGFWLMDAGSWQVQGHDLRGRWILPGSEFGFDLIGLNLWAV